MHVSDVISFLNNLAPLSLAADWDNPGMQVGPFSKKIEKIAIALDPTPQVMEQAAKNGVDLIITHHPLFFKSIKNIDPQSDQGRVLAYAYKHEITVVCAHTNLDMTLIGRSIADILNLKQVEPLEYGMQQVLKLVVFVPKNYEDQLKQAIFATGAGRIGDYDECFFTAPGAGGFKVPLEAKPFVGAPGEKELIAENRLEIILPASKRDLVTRAILASHPYEEPAYEYHPVQVQNRLWGLGVIGQLEVDGDILEFFKRRLSLKQVKWAGLKPGKGAKKVAVLPGSGGKYIKKAANLGAELFISGDISYHEGQLAEELGITVLDAGHFETEWPTLIYLKNKLINEIDKKQLNVDVILLEQKPVWHYE